MQISQNLWKTVAVLGTFALVSPKVYGGCASCEASPGYRYYGHYGTSNTCPTPPVPVPAAKPICHAPTVSHKHPCPVKKHHPKRHQIAKHNACSRCNERHANCTERASACDKDSCPVYRSPCPRLPARKMICQTINPADIVDFTCDDFDEKLENNEPYTCQAPFAQDPTIRTTWKIIGLKGERLLVSNTTDYVGFKDRNEKPMSLTQTCEYDDTGKKVLADRMKDTEKRAYHTSTCERFEGMHNCVFTSGDQPIHPPIITAPTQGDITVTTAAP